MRSIDHESERFRMKFTSLVALSVSCFAQSHVIRTGDGEIDRRKRAREWNASNCWEEGVEKTGHKAERQKKRGEERRMNDEGGRGGEWHCTCDEREE